MSSLALSNIILIWIYCHTKQRTIVIDIIRKPLDRTSEFSLVQLRIRGHQGFDESTNNLTQSNQCIFHSDDRIDGLIRAKTMKRDFRECAYGVSVNPFRILPIDGKDIRLRPNSQLL
ncbi:hypothetical protein DIE17_03740 [Burkholderia sp. Bp9099]|nr:hypothetical protein DIE17_03740 [Burkholderia sp. Bp9099]